MPELSEIDRFAIVAEVQRLAPDALVVVVPVDRAEDADAAVAAALTAQGFGPSEVTTKISVADVAEVAQSLKEVLH